MANLNSVHLIGRLTRDPEPIPAKAPGTKFGFAVNNRRRKPGAADEWEDEPVFLDCVIWNRGENKMAERLLQTVRKGQQLFIEGHLQWEQWDDKGGGGKRNKVSVVVDNFQYLDAKGDRPQEQQAPQQEVRREAPKPAAPARRIAALEDDEYDDPSPSRRNGAAHDNGGGDDEIPF